MCPAWIEKCAQHVDSIIITCAHSSLAICWQTSPNILQFTNISTFGTNLYVRTCYKKWQNYFFHIFPHFHICPTFTKVWHLLTFPHSFTILASFLYFCTYDWKLLELADSSAIKLYCRYDRSNSINTAILLQANHSLQPSTSLLQHMHVSLHS